MRFHLVAAVLLAGVAMPASAQRAVPVDKRIDRLEQEMRAVQRKVFPGGNVEPEIRQPDAPLVQPGVPAGTPVADLTARVDALEAQLASITGQMEQNGHQVRQLEAALNQFRSEAQARFAEMEQSRATIQPAAQIDEPAPEEAPAPTAAQPSTSSADPAEDAYLAGFRLWEQKKFAEAQSALEEMAKKYPKHSKASWARNLAGRAYLDDGKPATAAKLFLNNYQTNPKGERAPDSLLYLGEALTRLGKTAEACQVYGELEEVYGPTLRAPLRQSLPKARAAAKCSS